MAEHDGSFRRLMEMVRGQPTVTGGRPGRPPKNRIPTTGHFATHLHERMKALSKMRTQHVDHLISTSDLYNDAAKQLATDLHGLLGDELRLPAGAVTLSGIFGLREMVSERPLVVALRDLEFQTVEQTRTTLYLDQAIWDALLEISFRFGLQMRRPIHVHRLLELSAAWYLAGEESPTE
ncbi:MAG: hypothetical protein JXA10_09740 [Anaerolineae bacterium]|nr:hypothetical protein [Anaerolineae bacterium]